LQAYRRAKWAPLSARTVKVIQFRTQTESTRRQDPQAIQSKSLPYEPHSAPHESGAGHAAHEPQPIPAAAPQAEQRPKRNRTRPARQIRRVMKAPSPAAVLAHALDPKRDQLRLLARILDLGRPAGVTAKSAPAVHETGPAGASRAGAFAAPAGGRPGRLLERLADPPRLPAAAQPALCQRQSRGRRGCDERSHAQGRPGVFPGGDPQPSRLAAAAGAQCLCRPSSQQPPAKPPERNRRCRWARLFRRLFRNAIVRPRSR